MTPNLCVAVKNVSRCLGQATVQSVRTECNKMHSLLTLRFLIKIILDTMQIIRNISNNKRRTLTIYTLIYVANIHVPANNVGDVSETAINYSRNRMLQQSSTDHAHPKPLSRTKIIRLLCILSTYGQVLSFRCGSSASKVTKKKNKKQKKNKKTKQKTKAPIGLKMKFLNKCFAWKSREVSLIYKTNTLPTCLSLYNLICETTG